MEVVGGRRKQQARAEERCFRPSQHPAGKVSWRVVLRASAPYIPTLPTLRHKPQPTGGFLSTRKVSTASLSPIASSFPSQMYDKCCLTPLKIATPAWSAPTTSLLVVCHPDTETRFTFLRPLILVPCSWLWRPVTCVGKYVAKSRVGWEITKRHYDITRPDKFRVRDITQGGYFNAPLRSTRCM